MTNFEYYRNEIEKTISEHDLTGFLLDHGCTDICYYGVTRWYMAEYVEPYKLTRFEKDILENLNERAIYIEIIKGETPWISGNGFILGCIDDYFPKAKFNGLEKERKYKISDILANCEVVD